MRSLACAGALDPAGRQANAASIVPAIAVPWTVGQ
jgi:hypothetical protein